MNTFTKYRDVAPNSDDESDNESVTSEDLLASSDEETEETEVIEPRFNLVENTKKDTQLRKIAEIFEDNVGTPIASTKINTIYSLNFCFSKIHKPFNQEDLKDISSYDDLNRYIQKVFLENDVTLPGDVQRQLRTFNDKFKDKGLTCYKTKGKKSRPIYKWDPKPLSEIELIVPPAARNIFKKQKDLENFSKKKKNKCEICGHSKGRMAVDHWRAHSIYNIDDVKIAVLLCEDCNNIHSNRDASHIMTKHKNDISVIQNWIKKEREIRDNGFEPNSEDKKAQDDNIKVIIDYWNKKDIDLTKQFKTITNSDNNLNNKFDKLNI